MTMQSQPRLIHHVRQNDQSQLDKGLDQMRVLVTAFEPYGQWKSNSSWDSLVAMLGEFGSMDGVITRKYPANLQTAHSRLQEDLRTGCDVVLHLGQLPGATSIQLEQIALNVAGNTTDSVSRAGPIIDDGPLAYQSTLPLDLWAQRIRERGVPARVSYHAGVYLCNALLYLSQHWFSKTNREGRVTFVHLPLTSSQSQIATNGHPQIDSTMPEQPSLPVELMATAIHTLIQSADEAVRL